MGNSTAWVVSLVVTALYYLFSTGGAGPASPAHHHSSSSLCHACPVMLRYMKRISPTSTVQGRGSKILPPKFFLLNLCKGDVIYLRGKAQVDGEPLVREQQQKNNFTEED